MAVQLSTRSYKWQNHCFTIRQQNIKIALYIIFHIEGEKIRIPIWHARHNLIKIIHKPFHQNRFVLEKKTVISMHLMGILEAIL
jgi:hypothetical protein